MKNGSIFQNIFIKLNDTIDKIIYYINSNFILNLKMKKFYNYINIKNENNINNFINYLKNLNQ